MRIVFTILICLLGAMPLAPAHAVDDAPEKPQGKAGDKTDAPEPATDVLAPYAILKLAVTGTVDQVIDPHTLRLQDGTLIRLIAIDIPGAENEPPGPVAAQAYDLVTKTALNKTYHFYQMRNQTVTQNRFGQTLALAVERVTGQSLQDELLRYGLARVWDGDNTGFDLKWLMDMEDKARNVSSGLWADDAPTRVMTAQNLPVTAIGQLTVVTGRIMSVVTLDNDMYLTLTEQGMKGFTIKLPNALRPVMARQDFDPFALNGRIIRARGIVKPQHGGLISIDHLWQLEVLPMTFMPKTEGTATIDAQQVDMP